VLLVLALPIGAAGQVTAHTLRAGDDVRVLAPSVRSSRLRGTVVLYQGSTLELRERGSGSVVSIPVVSIRRLARNEGVDRRRSSWKMARVGGFVGGAGGLVAGPLIATSRAPKYFGQIMIASGITGTLSGAALGAVLGAAFARDHWQSFRMPIAPTVTTSPAGSEIGVSIRLP
jgi:hypothetical protein